MAMLKSRVVNLSISSCPELKHEALPHAITHIRVLEIQPQCHPNDTEVRCRAKCVRLTEFDKCYVALSYAWEHTDDEVPIIGHAQPTWPTVAIVRRRPGWTDVRTIQIEPLHTGRKVDDE